MASRDPEVERAMSYEELKAKYDDHSEPYFIITPEFVYMNKAHVELKEMDDEYMRLNRGRRRFAERVPHSDRPKSRFLGIGAHIMRINEKNRPHLVEFCNAALHKYNAENQDAKFVFAELISANMHYGNGCTYNIAFDARDAVANDGAAHTFHAQVYDSRKTPNVEIKMCQIEPS